jgi:hypothetical protein
LAFEIISNIVGASCLFAAAIMIVRGFIVNSMKDKDEERQQSVPQLLINPE